MPDDRQLDDLLRRAADRPVDEAALARRVLARVAAEPQGLSDWLFAFPVPRLVPAGFAAVLALTPFAVAALPGPADPLEAAILGVASGLPAGVMLDLGLVSRGRE